MKNVISNQTINYQTAERKLIYIQKVNNKNGDWSAYNGLMKIGDATIDTFEIDNRPNSDDLRKIAERRIKSYMTTAGVPYTLEWAELAYSKKYNSWFRDYAVHDVLKRSGYEKSDKVMGAEWIQVDLKTAKAAITAVKEGHLSIDKKETISDKKIELREEQQNAIKQTKSVFKEYDKMLWNAKMRFGKTLTALQLIKEQKYQRVLLMTHRPVVSDGWFEDFYKLNMTQAGYQCASNERGHSLEDLYTSNKPFIYFKSIQDLRGSKLFGGKVADKNQLIAKIKWDLIIIDEAHEGTQTGLAQNVINGVTTKGHTKILELSGTPFNLLDEYKENQVFTWDYVMEQKAKYTWEKTNPNKPNPYEVLPKVNMYTFDIGKDFKKNAFKDIYDKSFNFNEFFRVNDLGNFVYEKEVNQFLDNITADNNKNNYPFSTQKFREQLRHTLWIMPSRKSAQAIAKLMNKHYVFGTEYTIVNVVDENDDIDKSDNDLQRVRAAIGKDPSITKTITLTVKKLTTGVNVKEWTGVIFLSNTNSAMQYLQAAFRAQTPYTDEKLGMKTNCYIFDFAPDRALTVMAESSQLNTGIGKRTTEKQREQMTELLNFLPIIGQDGHEMKKFNVDTLLTKIKRVYAEKAVRSGFDDDSLYSDELLMLDKVALDDFNKLKAIVGTTKEEKKPVKIDINSQGLTDEEYEQAIKAEKKAKKERSQEEQDALDKMKQLKKQCKTMISILRSVSIRIPMMIYGMDIKISDDVKINEFVSLVDDISWKEFMPQKVTKELFKKFIKYYDPEIFLEAGRIIRRHVVKLDELDPLERIDAIASVFNTFRNPDKETVLTPWRVVNLHFGKTLGGLSFYDRTYQYTTINGVKASDWINTPYTDKIFHEDTHILDINSKTGLYPLYATASLYFKKFNKLNNDTAGKFTFEDELILWKDILRENIFIIAKTPMAKAITKRTLAGYNDFDINIEYIENIANKAKKSIKNTVNEIKGDFNNMKFDVVIGNPPYQDESVGNNDSYTKPIYHLFMDLSYKLADIVTLITPARFLFKTGGTPKEWTENILKDNHFKIVMYTPDSSKVFPKTDIKGGIIISLRNKNILDLSIHEKYAPIGTYIPFKELNTIMHKVTKQNFSSFSDIIFAPESYRFTEKMHEDFPHINQKLSKGHRYDLKSNVLDKLNEVFFDKQPNDQYNYIQIYGLKNKKRTFQYIRKNYILNKTNINGWKVFVPESNGSGSLGETISTPLIGHTQTFISIGNFSTKFEANAVLNYVKTKFARVMLGIKKATQHNPKSTWQMVPMQNFTPNSDIDWTKSVHEIDLQLYKKYNLSDKEINFIETKVQAMD